MFLKVSDETYPQKIPYCPKFHSEKLEATIKKKMLV